MLANSAVISNTTFARIDFEVGMPFHGVHIKHNMMDESSGREACHTTYLALGISCGGYEGSNQRHAFIVQAECREPARSCSHQINLDNGRKLSVWEAVALLAGWKMGDSSLGTVVATSPHGTRLAAATWSRILVWSFDPSLLHPGELEYYFPERDFNKNKGFGRLRPTTLMPEGVVHKMLWVDEMTLYATTDRGLVRWNLGPMSNGDRGELTLAYDAWPETVIAAPVIAPITIKRNQTIQTPVKEHEVE